MKNLIFQLYDSNESKIGLIEITSKKNIIESNENDIVNLITKFTKIHKGKFRNEADFITELSRYIETETKGNFTSKRVFENYNDLYLDIEF